MKPNLPPFHHFIQTILESGKYPGSEVIADIDADSYQYLPLVTWTYLNNGQHNYGLWGGTLAVTILCDPSISESLLGHVYKQIHSWNDLDPDMGEMSNLKLGVENVIDRSVFDLVHSTLMNGKSVGQFNGQFELTILDWS